MATFTGADRAIGFLFDMVRNIADDYDSASTYAQGAYTIYSGTLYKCISAISTPEDFTPAHWQAVLIMDEVAAGGGGGSSTLAGLSDVALSSVANGDVLTFDSTINKWKNGVGGGGGGVDNILVASQRIGDGNYITVNNTKTGTFAFSKNQIPTPPNGYKVKVSINAVLNTNVGNYAILYLNDRELFRKSTWIGSYTGWFGKHFGMISDSGLIDLDDITPTTRYIDNTGQGYYNVYLQSSTSDAAYFDNITINVWFCKVG